MNQVANLLTDNFITRGLNRILQALKLPKSIISDLYSWIFPGTASKSEKILYLIGSGYILYRLSRLIYQNARRWSWVFRHIALKKQFRLDEFKAKYGHDRWVLITGFTGGIGLSFAKLFADLGFNLVLVGRNREKIKHALRWIGQWNDQIMTKVIDIELDSDRETLHQAIAEETKDMDIGIVINNAGVSSLGNAEDIQVKDSIRTYKVNAQTPIQICKIFVPRMMKNKSYRSAIVNVGSGVSVVPSPYLGTYPATKKFLDIVTNTINREYEQIDFLLVRPFGVSTDMMNGLKGPLMVTPDEVARQTLYNIGKNTDTFGAAIHKVSATVLLAMKQEQQFANLSKNFKKFLQINKIRA